VAAERDDDALSWGGDDDPTLDVGAASRTPRVTPTKADRDADGVEPRGDAAETGTSDAVASPEAEPAALPEGFTAVGKGADGVGRINADGTVTMPGEREPMGNVALVSIGLLGGIYLLYTVGWVLGGLAVSNNADYLLAPDGNAPPLWSAGNAVAVWLAVAAPAIWFFTVYFLTRDGRPWIRWVMLLVGVVLLLPWPFVAGRL
jgi:hypothetical protein